MPHIIILGEWEELLEQLSGYSETVQKGIENESYDGEQLIEAQNLLSATESLMTAIDTQHRAALDGHIADYEGFLGI